MRTTINRLAVISVIAVTCQVTNGQVFLPIPRELPDHTTIYSTLQSLAGNGSALLLHTTSPQRIYRWSPASGLTQVPFPSTVTPVAITDDGASILAQPGSGGGMFVSRNYGETIEQLPVHGSYFTHVSGDARNIAQSNYRWREGSGFFTIPSLPPLPNYYYPDGRFERFFPGGFSSLTMSDDGTFLTGYIAYGSELVLPSGEAVTGPGRRFNGVWRESVGVPERMNDVYGIDLIIEDISASGRYGVARGTSSVQFVDFQLHTTTSIEGLSILGPVFMSDDASTICTSINMWDAAHGTRTISQVLSDAGLNINGWSNIRLTEISDDGTTLFGYGTAPDGDGQAFYATIPAPGTAFVCVVFCSVFTRRRRKVDVA